MGRDALSVIRPGPRQPEYRSAQGHSKSGRESRELNGIPLLFKAVLSKMSGETRRRVLLPSGEGGPKGRMRAGMPMFRHSSPHPALRATLSRRERDSRKTGLHIRESAGSLMGL